MWRQKVSSCLLITIVGVLVWLMGGLCFASREELSHDQGGRNVDAFWRPLPSVDRTRGVAVLFMPRAFPCFVREVSVYVDATTEFRVHVMDSDQNQLCESATVAAVQAVSWVSYRIPSEVRLESGRFYVVADIVNPPEPGVGMTTGVGGTTTLNTKSWDSISGVSQGGSGPTGGDATIRAVVDLPVEFMLDMGGTVRNDHFFVWFDSPMDPSTLNSETISFKYGAENITGAYEYDDALMRLEFIPEPLLAPQSFTVDVSTAIADVYGNHPALAVHKFWRVDDQIDDVAPPRPENLAIRPGDQSLVVSWMAVPLGDAVGYYLYWGPCPPKMTHEEWAASADKADVGNVTEYSILVEGPELPYRVGVSAYDRARNESQIAFDDALAHRGSVLLVVETPSPIHVTDQGELQLEDSLRAGAFDYNIWSEREQAVLPDVAHLEQFDLVFWSMGWRFASLNAGVMERLQSFMSCGGQLYYEAHNLLSVKHLENPFLPEWLHLKYDRYCTDFDAPVSVGVPHHVLGDGLELIYITKAGANKDFFEPQDGAVGFLHVKDKPEEMCALHYEDTGDFGYRLVFSTAILAPVYNTHQRDKLLSRALCWLEGKDLDFRVAANTRVIEPYSVLELFVSANSLEFEGDVDAYLAVLVEAEGGSMLLFYDGAGFVSEMTPFVSGAHLDPGLFLPRTKIFEYLYRGGLPAGKYTFFVALMQAGTQTFLTAPRSTTVFVR